tara:strand:- start:1407 stop:1547 length:141 start_codon:yes stop_codon:yes gene_type:complete
MKTAMRKYRLVKTSKSQRHLMDVNEEVMIVNRKEERECLFLNKKLS